MGVSNVQVGGQLRRMEEAHQVAEKGSVHVLGEGSILIRAAVLEFEAIVDYVLTARMRFQLRQSDERQAGWVSERKKDMLIN